MKIELNKVYEDGRGIQWKIISSTNSRISPTYVGHNVSQTETEYFSPEGRYSCFTFDDDRNLVKLIGDDFTEVKK